MEEMTLVELLDSADSEVQIQTAMKLCTLPARQRYRMVEEGAVSPLLSMLCSHNSDVVKSALLALLRLAFGSERTKIKIVKSGAVPLLLKLLKREESGAETLSDLSSTTLLILSTCSSNKQAIANAGSIPVLLDIIDPRSKFNLTEQARQDAISSLHNLSTHKDNVRAIMNGGGVATLLRLLYATPKPSDLSEKALSVLEILAAASTSALEQVAAVEEGGGTAALVEAMEEGSPEERESAAAILVMMCRRSREKYREMILREGAMAAVLQMSGGEGRGREVAGELLRLLRDYRERKKGGRRRSVVVMKREALEKIMEEIRAEKVGTVLGLVKQLIATLHKR